MLLLTHLVFFGLLSFVLNIKVSLLGFIFSALPDIDNPNSIIGQLFPKLSNYLFMYFGHRGLTHSIIPLIVLSIVSIYSFEPLLAYASHLFLDALNPFGIMLFYPKNSRIVLFNLASAGSNKELLFIIVLIALVSAYAYFWRAK
jgi:inner membrane protein